MEIFLIILEFVVIIVLQLLGIGFHVMQKVLIYDQQYPKLKMPEIFKVFWDEDWGSLLVSALVFFLNLVAHGVIHIWFSDVTHMVWLHVPYLAWSFILALVLGYAGQRIAYKFLGKAADRLDQLADTIEKTAQKPA